MKLGLWTTFVLVSLLLRATTVHGQQPPNKPDDTAREVLEIKQFLLQVVARLEKIEGQISGPEGQTQRELDGAEALQTQHNYKPREGYVPNAQTAIAVAVAVWSPIYGANKIKNELSNSTAVNAPRHVINRFSESDLTWKASAPDSFDKPVVTLGVRCTNHGQSEYAGFQSVIPVPGWAGE